MENTEQFRIGHFGFSAISPGELGASKYTLVTISADRSGSTSGFQIEMERCIKESVKALQMGPYADNLLLRVLVYDSKVEEIHGFRPLPAINLGDYDGILRPKGSTVFFDAHLNALEATINYGIELHKQDFESNAILFNITDGDDRDSHYTPNDIVAAKEGLKQKECLESLQDVLIGINITKPDIQKFLEDAKASCGFTDFISTDKVTAEVIARLIHFISQSVSSASQACGTGSVSRLVEF